jgi:poly(beta-D-mannuronate) lyase
VSLRSLPVLLALLGTAFAREIPADDSEALKKAFAGAQPGDVITMANGVWEDAEIVFRAVGTAEAPITLKAQTPGQVILSGKSSLRFVGCHLVAEGLLFKNGGLPKGHVVAFRGDSDEEAGDCRLTNSAIIDYNAEGNSSSNWVSLYGARNRVDHCRFSGKTSEGPLLVVWLNGQPNDHRIDRNYFGRRSFDGENGGETIRVGDSKTSLQVSRTVVEENLFEDCDGEVEIVSNKSCENIYRRNTFRRNAGTLTLRHGNGCLVEGNWFFGEGKASSGGIRIIGEDHRVINNYLAGLTGERFFSAIGFMAAIENSEPSGYVQVRRAIVAFNTVVDCRNSIFLGIGYGTRKRTLPPRDCLVANNIIVSRSAPLVTQFLEPERLSWLGNIMFGADTGLPPGPGLIVRDPGLQQDGSGLWVPAKGGQVSAVAVPELREIHEDIFGRPRGENPEAGCMQISADSPRRFGPLAPGDVGINW